MAAWLQRLRRRPWRAAVGTWLVAEGGFHILCRHRVKEANEPTYQREVPLLSRSQRQELFQRCMAHVPAPGGKEGVQTFVQGWFLGTPVHELSREDIRGWLSWGLFSRREEQLDSSEAKELDGYISAVERDAGVVFPSVGAPRAPCMKPDLQKFGIGCEVTPLPLAFYLAILITDTLTAARLSWLGFKLHRIDESSVKYWAKTCSASEAPAAQSSADSQRPAGDHEHRRQAAVFVHGIGIGLLPYCFAVIPELLRHQGDGRLGDVILWEQPHISMSVPDIISGTMPPTGKEVMHALDVIATRHAGSRERSLVLIGHSFGSFLVAQACRKRADHLSGAVFIDPPCFMLHLDAVTRGFLYQKPGGRRRGVGGAMHSLLRSELTINMQMRRHFHWHENCCWIEDIRAARLTGVAEVTPPRTLICIAERDNVIPVQSVMQYLHGELAEDPTAFKLVFLEDALHGEAIISPVATQRVFEGLEAILDAAA